MLLYYQGVIHRVYLWLFSHASLENASGTAAVIDALTIIQDPDFDAHLFNIKLKIITCCHKIFGRIAGRHK